MVIWLQTFSECSEQGQHFRVPEPGLSLCSEGVTSQDGNGQMPCRAMLGCSGTAFGPWAIKSSSLEHEVGLFP